MSASNLPATGTRPGCAGTHVVARTAGACEHAGRPARRRWTAMASCRRLWYTNVPEPADAEAYVDAARWPSRRSGIEVPFVVRDADGVVVGSTRYYDMDPSVPRLQHRLHLLRAARAAHRPQYRGQAAAARPCLRDAGLHRRSVSRRAGSTRPRAPRSRAWARSRTACCATIAAMPTAALRDTVAFSIIDIGMAGGETQPAVHGWNGEAATNG